MLDGEMVPFGAVDKDEEVDKFRVEKIANLKPVFEEPELGTITAANASKLNDGAAALVLASEEFASKNGLRPIAKILSWSDFALAPVDFSQAPGFAVKAALKKAHKSVKDIDFWEMNEAFSCVPIVNAKKLHVDLTRVNVDGGAVALGHPIGMSGARIVGALARILRQRDGELGCASICNGGGGATAIVIQRY
jgi:acetyl-CoA C-acetyltransferase